ncbi:Tetratricopeptide repeat-containing protein [Desulfuromusa kysingii]|uniref:Tetratricopeptide repeat-containing protein n=1 Tax=Desulfuromusa kysingii TaxID=37625 RepID=A0A1H4BKC4_9BACT|nr:tetratricopeptide repeat protein [Desulfuromusa kysingii]SEA48590.1 Tetratricopeptide repeat-containing protein [Desulfuromusa kysingii]
MKKETILLVVITMAIGILSGVIFTNAKKHTGTENQQFAPVPVIDYQQKINNLQAFLTKEPTNRNAWVQLGHNYFDSNQPMKAIEAYDKALEIDSHDANVLTDQGIMYRRLGWFDKAIENFKQANTLDPRHVQSLFNLGIVYRDDLGDRDKAKEVWTTYLEISPIGNEADRVRNMIDHMENGH